MSRDVESSYGHMEGGEGMGGGTRGKRERRDQAAPFIVGWATLLLPGNCGKEHT